MKAKLSLLMAILLLSNLVCAQSNNENLKNHHTIGFYGGIKGNSAMEVTAIPTIATMKAGFIGGIEYGYWFSDEWLVGLSAGFISANFNVRLANVEANAVVGVLFGFKYYPTALKLGDIGRVYASLYAGPYVGLATRDSGINVSSENFTETVVGGQFGVGMDLFIARWLKIGPSLNYSIIGDFKEISVNKQNYSGFGFVINMGFVL